MALDDLTDIAFFVSLVDAGSITAASRRLSVSSAAVSRRLAKLEERLGIGLIIRNTRHFHLSDSGQIYYDGGLKIVEENERLESEVIQSDQSLKGSLSIGAPLELGRHKLAPFIASFFEKHPQLQLNLAVASDGHYDFDDYLDIIIRLGLPDSNGALVTKIVTTVKVICASPEYIEKNGEPLTLEDLQKHTCLCLRRYKSMEVINQWVLENETTSHVVSVQPALSSNNAEIVHDWALSGEGIAYKLYSDAYESLRNGSLIRILPQYKGESVPLYAVLPSRNHIKRSVRLLLEELKIYIKNTVEFYQ